MKNNKNGNWKNRIQMWKKEWNYWSQIFLVPIYFLSFCSIRNKRIWLFGSSFGKRFADSPRYFYLYLSSLDEKEIRPIWISENKEIINLLNSAGFEAYYKKSLKGLWFCLRGKVYLYDNYPKDISHYLSGGATKINLWHGIPLKKIQMDNIHDQVRHPENFRKRIYYLLRRFSDEKPSHYVLSTSNFYKPIFSSAFATKNVIVQGYPRTDIFKGDLIQNQFLDAEKKALNVIWEEKKKGKKILLYMPTFRDSETVFFDTINLGEFGRFLEENNFLLCTKLHCKSKLRKEFQEISGNGIYNIDADCDPYVFVKDSDGLITDYSSIYFDYMLCEKPIFFFYYDLAVYLEQSRELYFDYQEFTKGVKVKTGAQLMEALRNFDQAEAAVKAEPAVVNGVNNLALERKLLIEKTFDYGKDYASPALYVTIKEILNKSERRFKK